MLCRHSLLLRPVLSVRCVVLTSCGRAQGLSFVFLNWALLVPDDVSCVILRQCGGADRIRPADLVLFYIGFFVVVFNFVDSGSLLTF